MRLPEWARKGATHFESLNTLKRSLRELRLHTVCESARCPNIHDCFHRGAATFMILGNLCTRGCGFCSVPKGSPAKQDMRLDPREPANIARMAATMALRYVVITSVNRDDLDDGGSRHFAETVREVRAALPGARVEVLTPDFCGDAEAIIRQYLQPTRRNLPVAAYISPAQFDAWRDYGLAIGFRMVFSGPLVRSSYMADLVDEQASH